MNQKELEEEIAEMLTEHIESADPHELLAMSMAVMKDCECAFCEKLGGLCDQLHGLI
jgi:hypothetical protein